jgi:low affinity Fe/Cu permease
MPRQSTSKRAANHRQNGKRAAALAANCKSLSNGSAHQVGTFSGFAHTIAQWSGKPAAFLIALALIVVWAVTGPLFNYSDTWQLVINTSTTIVTFLMVFLIQNTQNRDTMALQIKLADLIVALRGADNRLAAAEDLDDAELEALHQEYRKFAENTLQTLEKRRACESAN